MEAIRLRNVWLKYKIEFRENRKSVLEDFSALKGIDLSVSNGESVCIVGDNGAGKTSLLKVIAGMLKPDRGSVHVNGTVSGLMDIGAGFQKDLTGSENIYLISSLFGLDKKETDSRYGDIVRFASLGRFIHAPVKNYSQGMYMRLGFAIAIHMGPRILLIDDTFAVGDIYTQRKCINKIFEFKESGKTIIFVAHDLEMAKRICTRGIFLRDGEIIKDGPMDKVCTYYAETVGNKKGITLSGMGALGAVFNNGRLILRWNGSAITTNLSGHSSMFFSGREYLSTTATWQARKLKNENGIIALGRWPDIPLWQYWKITFSGEKEFFWEIGAKKLKVSKEIFPEQYAARVIFADRYKNYLSLNGEEEFPETFLHGEEWQCSLVKYPENAIVGIKDTAGNPDALPVVVFERLEDSKEVFCQVGNTGSEIHGRVLQYVAFPKDADRQDAPARQKCFLIKISIFDTEEERLRMRLNSVRDRINSEKLIHCGALSVLCKEHKIEIYWQGILLTQDIGMDTQFNYQHKEYSVRDGHWDVRKENDNQITIVIFWGDDPPFRQVWRLKLEGNNTLSWKVETEIVKGRGRLKNPKTELILSGIYEKWITERERGDFKRTDVRGGVVLSRYTNHFIGTDGLYKKERLILPGVVLSCQDAYPRISYIIKDKSSVPLIKLQYLAIEPEEETFIASGSHNYFEGKITIVPTTQKLPVSERTPPKIETGRLAFVFDHGKGRIFWDGVELTKGLGLYSSIFLENRWQDSSQATWSIKETGNKRIVALGRWPWVAMTQIWEISIEQDTILWGITKHSHKELSLEREQVNLMASERYQEWFSLSEACGRFPDIFLEHNGLSWERLWLAEGIFSLGIRSKKNRISNILHRSSIPSIIFDCSSEYQRLSAVVENTDNIFSARILQYELGPGQLDNSGNKNSKYFNGRIRIAT